MTDKIRSVGDLMDKNVEYIKTISIGQYNESGVNIGFETAYNVIKKDIEALLTQDRQALLDAIVSVLDGLPGSQAVLNPNPLSLGDVMISRDRVKTAIKNLLDVNK